jgi:hypothetical protein
LVHEKRETFGGEAAGLMILEIYGGTEEMLVDDCKSELDSGRSIGKTGDEGAPDGIPEALAAAGRSDGNGKPGGALRLGTLMDLRFGGGNGATLGACSPASSGRLEELVPGRMNAALGRKGTEFTDDPAKVVSASQAFFCSILR